jgi:hypothetical protein
MRRSNSKRFPSELPCPARTGAAIEQHEIVVRIESEASQIVGDRESRLASADHDD